MTDGAAGGTELVVLLSDDGEPIGTAEKATVHTEATPLHLAVSCHVFDGAGRVLVTRRALTKATWPGVWTNSFCGHPAPGETLDGAVRRRAREELGLELSEVSPVLPGFRYRALDASGVVENELCPTFRATTDGAVRGHPAEVAEWAWVDAADLIAGVAATPFAFSPWLRLQLEEWARRPEDYPGR